MKKFRSVLIGSVAVSILIFTPLTFAFCLEKNKIPLKAGVKTFSWGNTRITHVVPYKLVRNGYGKIAIRCELNSEYNLKVDYKISRQTFYRSDGNLTGTVTTPATITFTGCQLSGAKTRGGTKIEFSAPALAPNWGIPVSVKCQNI